MSAFSNRAGLLVAGSAARSIRGTSRSTRRKRASAAAAAAMGVAFGSSLRFENSETALVQAARAASARPRAASARPSRTKLTTSCSGSPAGGRFRWYACTVRTT